MNSDNQKRPTDTDQAVLLILEELQAKAAANPAPTPEPVSDEGEVALAEPMVRLTADGVEQEETPASHGSEKRRANPFVRLFRYLIPQRGDGWVESLRKCFFALALITLISSAVYLVHDSVWVPTQNKEMYKELEEIIHRVENPTPEQYREIMDELYAKNNDFRGWLTYKSNADKDFLQIDYPVVYSGDNDYYLEHDFNKNYNKNGTLFFDGRNNYTLTSSENKVSIIYGHNMISGQMFAHLNQFLNGVSYARSAPRMSLKTLQGESTYKVFAIALIDADATQDTRFNYLRISFANDLEFLYHVDEIRARSLFNYDGVDVQEGDELLVLSTCTNESQVHMEDGRLAVFARKVRPGESEVVNTSQISVNHNAIYPYAWYINQEIDPHPYYGGQYQIPQSTITTTPVAGTSETASDSTTTGLQFETVTPTTPPPRDVVLGTGSVIRPTYTEEEEDTTTTATKTTGKKPTETKNTTQTTAAQTTQATQEEPVTTAATAEPEPTETQQEETPATQE